MKKKILGLVLTLVILSSICSFTPLTIAAENSSNVYSFELSYHGFSNVMDCLEIIGSSSYRVNNNTDYVLDDTIYVNNECTIRAMKDIGIEIYRVADNISLEETFIDNNTLKIANIGDSTRISNYGYLDNYVDYFGEQEKEVKLKTGTYVLQIDNDAAMAFPCRVVVGNGVYQQEISVYLNNEKIEFDVPPVVENGRTLVPVRAVLEKMGMEVGWDEATSSITASGKGNRILMKIDDYNFVVNGETKYSDVPPKLIDGRTMIPIRNIIEPIGAKVEWDGENRIVYITYTPDENYKTFTVNNSDKIEAYKFESGYYVDSSIILPLLSGYDDKYNDLSGILKIWDEGVNVGLNISYDLTSNKEGDYVTAEIKCSDGTWLKDSLYKKHYKKTNIVMTRKDDKSYINLEDITWLANYTTDYEYAEIYSKGMDDSVACLISADEYSNPKFDDGVNKWVFDAEHFGWTDEQLKKYVLNQKIWGNIAQGALAIYDMEFKNLKEESINSMVDVLVMPSEHQMSENIENKFSENQAGDVLLDFATVLKKADKLLLEDCGVYEMMSEKSKQYCKGIMKEASVIVFLNDAYLSTQQELLKIQAVLECSEDNRLRLKKLIDDLPQTYKEKNKRFFEMMCDRLNEYDDYSYGIMFLEEAGENLLSGVANLANDKIVAGGGMKASIAQFALDCARFAIDGLASGKIKGISDQGVFHSLYTFSILTNEYYTDLWNQRNQYLHDFPISYQEKMKNAAIFTIKSGNDSRRMFVQAREEIMTAKQREENYVGHESILHYCNVSDSIYLHAWTKAVVK